MSSKYPGSQDPNVLESSCGPGYKGHSSLFAEHQVDVPKMPQSSEANPSITINLDKGWRVSIDLSRRKFHQYVNGMGDGDAKDPLEMEVEDPVPMEVDRHPEETVLTAIMDQQLSMFHVPSQPAIIASVLGSGKPQLHNAEIIGAGLNSDVIEPYIEENLVNYGSNEEQRRVNTRLLAPEEIISRLQECCQCFPKQRFETREEALGHQQHHHGLKFCPVCLKLIQCQDPDNVRDYMLEHLEQNHFFNDRGDVHCPVCMQRCNHILCMDHMYRKHLNPILMKRKESVPAIVPVIDDISKDKSIPPPIHFFQPHGYASTVQGSNMTRMKPEPFVFSPPGINSVAPSQSSEKQGTRLKSGNIVAHKVLTKKLVTHSRIHSRAPVDKNGVLENFFCSNHYPNIIDKLELAEKVGSTYRQVSLWFVNRRRRVTLNKQKSQNIQLERGNCPEKKTDVDPSDSASHQGDKTKQDFRNVVGIREVPNYLAKEKQSKDQSVQDWIDKICDPVESNEVCGFEDDTVNAEAEPQIGNTELAATSVCSTEEEYEPVIGSDEEESSMGNLEMEPDIGSIEAQPSITEVDADPSIEIEDANPDAGSQDASCDIGNVDTNPSTAYEDADSEIRNENADSETRNEDADSETRNEDADSEIRNESDNPDVRYKDQDPTIEHETRNPYNGNSKTELRICNAGGERTIGNTKPELIIGNGVREPQKGSTESLPTVTDGTQRKRPRKQTLTVMKESMESSEFCEPLKPPPKEIPNQLFSTNRKGSTTVTLTNEETLSTSIGCTNQKLPSDKVSIPTISAFVISNKANPVKIRTRELPLKQRNIMLQFWAEKQFPNKKDYVMLANEAKITRDQVKKWFQWQRGNLKMFLKQTTQIDGRKRNGYIQKCLTQRNFNLKKSNIINLLERFKTTRRINGHYTYDQMHTLLDHFDHNMNPSDQEIRQLSEQLNLKMSTIKRWFVRHRRSHKQFQAETSNIAELKDKISPNGGNECVHPVTEIIGRREESYAISGNSLIQDMKLKFLPIVKVERLPASREDWPKWIDNEPVNLKSVLQNSIAAKRKVASKLSTTQKARQIKASKHSSEAPHLTPETTLSETNETPTQSLSSNVLAMPVLRRIIIRKKKRKRDFLNWQKDFLLNSFQNCEKPDKHEVARLMERTRLSDVQIKAWFNIRRFENRHRVQHSSQSIATPELRTYSKKTSTLKSTTGSPSKDSSSSAKVSLMKASTVHTRASTRQEKLSKSITTQDSRFTGESTPSISDTASLMDSSPSTKAENHPCLIKPIQPSRVKKEASRIDPSIYHLPQKYSGTGFSEPQRTVLVREFDKCQYPTLKTIQNLANEIGLTIVQVRTWFTYNRYRLKQGNPLKYLPLNYNPDKALKGSRRNSEKDLKTRNFKPPKEDQVPLTLTTNEDETAEFKKEIINNYEEGATNRNNNEDGDGIFLSPLILSSERAVQTRPEKLIQRFTFIMKLERSLFEKKVSEVNLSFQKIIKLLCPADKACDDLVENESKRLQELITLCVSKWKMNFTETQREFLLETRLKIMNELLRMNREDNWTNMVVKCHTENIFQTWHDVGAYALLSDITMNEAINDFCSMLDLEIAEDAYFRKPVWWLPSLLCGSGK